MLASRAQNYYFVLFQALSFIKAKKFKRNVAQVTRLSKSNEQCSSAPFNQPRKGFTVFEDDSTPSDANDFLVALV